MPNTRGVGGMAMIPATVVFATSPPCPPGLLIKADVSEYRYPPSVPSAGAVPEDGWMQMDYYDKEGEIPGQDMEDGYIGLVLTGQGH
ncbi:hypothetical protein PGT21_012299 [Puccinia graminis f. sp. tritici]|uniref:Uncharacterized protein n=1 Tax=Puccinia graminis f. sp. tritici TaxID=56615 RepID=A0A5B0PU45_PUCGR|nr:hypothetical protein PGT21_012299 [Puccinia graminis f. sp. tritici]KAA1132326.1 hypothetical protein PGTUg99_008222 [Puccinia graminis f. sp. tritici]